MCITKESLSLKCVKLSATKFEEAGYKTGIYAE